MNSLRHNSAISERLTSERGQSLVLAIIVLLVLTISAGAIAQLMMSNQSISNHEKQGQQALTGGEAGLDVAANWVVANDAGGVLSVAPNSPHTGSTTVAGNTVTWSAAKVSTGQWTVTSTTSSPNGKVTRILQEQLQSKQVPGSPATFWGYGFVMGGARNPGAYTPYQICESSLGSDQPTRFQNSGRVQVPIWISGDVCTSGGGDPPIGNPTSGSPITVHVGGWIYGSNGPTDLVGLSSSPVANFDSVYGCYDKHTSSGTVAIPCDQSGPATTSGKSGVFSTAWNPATTTVTPPKITASDEQGYYDNSSPGPKHPCVGALSTGTWPTNLFDSAGSTVPDTSLGTKDFVTLLGSNAFDCKTNEGGELKWTPGGNGGTLLLKGTVFFDASLTTSGGNDMVTLAQNSNGSIYIDGSLVMSNSSSICQYITSICDPTSDGWDPSSHPTDANIFFSAYNRANAVPGIDLQGNSGFEGTLYTNGEFQLGNSAHIGGSIFGDFAGIIGNGSFKVTSVIPSGAVGSATTTTAWNVAPRTWRQCPTSGCS